MLLCESWGKKTQFLLTKQLRIIAGSKNSNSRCWLKSHSLLTLPSQHIPKIIPDIFCSLSDKAALPKIQSEVQILLLISCRFLSVYFHQKYMLKRGNMICFPLPFDMAYWAKPCILSVNVASNSYCASSLLGE